MTEPPNELALLSDISFCLHNIVALLSYHKPSRCLPASVEAVKFIAEFRNGVAIEPGWVVRDLNSNDVPPRIIAVFPDRTEAERYAHQRNIYG
jgi:hypothetical protein